MRVALQAGIKFRSARQAYQFALGVLDAAYSSRLQLFRLSLC